MDLLRQLKQPIPQKLTLLLHDAKKRADKRHAKRIANRQSACTSRARKKALVEEMTALNARLRRQALILSLLPDLVIVIDTEGTITFCSAQVERVLQHSIDDLVGAPLTDIIDPGSRDRLSALIQGLVASSRRNELETTGKSGALEDAQHPATRSDKKQEKKSKLKNDEEDSGYPTSGTASANVVTETSFPLSVVQVDPGGVNTAGTDGENDVNSDASHSKQPSSLTANSVTGNSGSDGDHGGKKSSTGMGNTKTLSKEDTSISQSSDSSNTSSNTVSSDAKNLLNANANLERNVRYHNKKIMKDKRGSYKDDVLGAAVTANNASARLSSLQHLRSADSSEEDSGYRESNDSREETSSSSDGETRSQRNGRFWRVVSVGWIFTDMVLTVVFLAF
jgi:PAS domain S-box-containing protein